MKCETLDLETAYLKNMLAEKDKRIDELSDKIQILKNLIKVLQENK